MTVHATVHHDEKWFMYVFYSKTIFKPRTIDQEKPSKIKSLRPLQTEHQHQEIAELTIKHSNGASNKPMKK